MHLDPKCGLCVVGIDKAALVCGLNGQGAIKLPGGEVWTNWALKDYGLEDTTTPTTSIRPQKLAIKETRT